MLINCKLSRFNTHKLKLLKDSTDFLSEKEVVKNSDEFGLEDFAAIWSIIKSIESWQQQE